MDKIKELLNDSKKRKYVVIACILPFIIAIGVFGLLIVKDIKTIIGTVVEQDTPQEENKYYIASMDYLLRDNATDYQTELFEGLRSLIDSNASDLDISESVVKNYVADFYTWTNKAGQYDVGGMYYVFNQQKNIIYTQARDGMYKYINEYINEYGSKELLEVVSVETTSEAMTDFYVIGEQNYDGFIVHANWKYDQTKKFDSSKFATKLDFVVVITNGHYEIVEISEVIA